MDKFKAWIGGERGRLTELASTLGITHSAISQWKQVPAERIGDVARATGLRPQELRPDIFAKANQ